MLKITKEIKETTPTTTYATATTALSSLDSTATTPAIRRTKATIPTTNIPQYEHPTSSISGTITKATTRGNVDQQVRQPTGNRREIK